jgi:hypothetical protein
MKGIETSSTSLDNSNLIDRYAREVAALDAILYQHEDMFYLPPAAHKEKRVLDELFDDMTTSPHVVDYCDNEDQIEVLRHHYINEFGGNHKNVKEEEAEVLRDYNANSIIHKVVDDMPSTYRGRDGAIDAWHDLSSYLEGPCNFDLTHVKVCKNHAQVNWTVECNTKSKHKTLFGTDSFTFDDTNHIVMQTTVALSKED